MSRQPAPLELIGAEEARLGSELGAALPESYRVFLTHSNGYDYNGLVFYGVGMSPDSPDADGFWQSVIDSNHLWREGPGADQYLVLGETGTDLFTVDLDGAKPVLRDRISSDINEEFSSVDDALRKLISRYK